MNIDWQKLHDWIMVSLYFLIVGWFYSMAGLAFFNAVRNGL